MTQKELIEIIQQHFPDQGESIIRSSLNRALNDFTAKTSITDAVATDTIVKDKRMYDLDPGMLTIKRVEIDSVQIPRLVTPPVKGDLD
tara:strand:+ start:11372 stop:11635 length:264 start_codon:yes stop_codon:yes gene_type:complete